MGRKQNQVEPLLFVLVDEKARTSDDIQMDLPTPGGPGNWVSWQPTAQRPYLRRKQWAGIRVTTAPGGWWHAKTHRAFVVDVDEVIGREDDDLFAKRVRLLREATPADLETVGIYVTGTHKFADGCWFAVTRTYQKRRFVYAFGNAKIEACGDTIKVIARDRATVRAFGAIVVARDDVMVKASRHAQVIASGRAIVHAKDGTVVRAFHGSVVFAQGSSVVLAEEGVRVRLKGQAVRLDHVPYRNTPRIMTSRDQRDLRAMERRGEPDALAELLHGRSEGLGDQRRLDAADRAREFARASV
jgi:hypothetical protein